MKEDKLIDAIGLIDDNYILGALTKKRSLKRSIAVAVAVILFFVFSFGTLAATADPFYNMLYRVSPTLAGALKPVKLSSVDNGIKMEVQSAAVYENEAVIFITMQDLEQDRIDETLDLFDSYKINCPFDSSAHCEKVGFDSETKKATFMISISQWNKKSIEGDKITFSISEMLSKKQVFEGELTELDINNAREVKGSIAYSGSHRGGSVKQGESIEQYRERLEKERFLSPNSEDALSPVEGVKITGMGFIEGKLHIQLYFEDILSYDNHGSIILYDKDGNQAECYSYSFWDSEKVGSFEEFVYDISPEKVGEYRAEGRFVTCRTNIKGKWKVTFPLQNK